MEQAVTRRWYKHWATHEASKLVSPVRFVSVLPCPADQSSSTLKSVHWNWIDPRLPEQLLWQVMLPDGPINVPADTVLALQKVKGQKPLRQAIRWVTRIYKCKKYIVIVMPYHWYNLSYHLHSRTLSHTHSGIPTLCIAAALSQLSVIYTLTLPSKLTGLTGLHWMVAPLKWEAVANSRTTDIRTRSSAWQGTELNTITQVAIVHAI